jgi:tRNA nucleotidyltransferase (CCA-adding enzyme)
MTIKLTDYVRYVLETLNAAGHEAVVVGGCVRDSILGKTPGDWDIATAAIPQETKAAFAGKRVIETGLKHGTVTVLLEAPVEITTYRVDGAYSDSRRPDTVSYTRSLAEDLKRRDFTVNALAYAPDMGLTDLFGGLDDLKSGVLRCVGDPEERSGEDALRVMRAARFCAVLGLAIEEKTAAAMLKLAPSLKNVSAERLAVELSKAICGEHIERALIEHGYVFAKIIPELAAMFGFCQHTRYHHLDVWAHTARAVAEAEPNLTIRLAMLFHDIGKPKTFTLENPGEGHFYGHAHVGAEIAERALERLKFDNRTREETVFLVKRHCDQITPEQKPMKCLLNRMGEPLLRKLLAVNLADCRSQAPEFREERVRHFELALSVLEKILAENQAFSLKDLAIDGHDLIKAGFMPGPKLGEALQTLLNQVMDETLPNEKTALTEAARLIL